MVQLQKLVGANGVVFQQLENPTDAQILRCGDIFEDLMKAEVSTYILCGGDRTLFKSLGLATIRAGILDGEFYAATDDSGDVLGYVMTMPRGKLLYSTEEQRKLGYDDFTSRLSEEGKAYYSDFYAKTFPQFISSCIEPLNMVDIWWLHLVMTPKEHQRQGIATTLIRMVLDKALAAGDTIALSTTNAVNIPIYEKMGFKVVGMKDGPSPWGDWSVWVLRYEAGPESA